MNTMSDFLKKANKIREDYFNKKYALNDKAKKFLEKSLKGFPIEISYLDIQPSGILINIDYRDSSGTTHFEYELEDYCIRVYIFSDEENANKIKKELDKIFK